MLSHLKIFSEIFYTKEMEKLCEIEEIVEAGKSRSWEM